MTTINLNCSFTHIHSFTPHNLRVELFYFLFSTVEEIEAQRSEVVPLKSCLNVSRTWTPVLNSRATEEPPAGPHRVNFSSSQSFKDMNDYWRWLLNISYSASLCFIRITNDHQVPSSSCLHLNTLHVPVSLFKDGLWNKKNDNYSHRLTN